MKKDTTDKRVEELEIQNSLLHKQLKAVNEKQLDIAPFCNEASLLQNEINHILLKLVGEMYRIKQIEAILKEIAHRSSDLRKKLSEVEELVQNQLTWIGANSTFPVNMPQKTVGGLKTELEI